MRHRLTPGRRGRPGRRLVVGVDGGFAAVAWALAGGKRHVVRVARRRGDAALDHRPGLQPPGTRGRTPAKGKRQRRLQGGAEHADTPWEDVAVDWYGGQRQQWGVFSRTALWSTPRWPPVDMRVVLVADPEGKLRMEACFWTDPQATPVQILEWGVRRGSVAVTCEEA